MAAAPAARALGAAHVHPFPYLVISSARTVCHRSLLYPLGGLMKAEDDRKGKICFLKATGSAAPMEKKPGAQPPPLSAVGGEGGRCPSAAGA
jgi:hypothetical protein